MKNFTIDWGSPRCFPPAWFAIAALPAVKRALLLMVARLAAAGSVR